MSECSVTFTSSYNMTCSFNGKKKKMSRLSISAQAGGGINEFNRSVSVPAMQINRLNSR